MSQPTHIHYLTQHSSDYPSMLIDRLGNDAPESIAYIGNINILSLPKIALFCSKEAPGSVILHTFDKVAGFRDNGRCVISGFHSPIEKECLKILLRGSQPIILCLARALEGMRINEDFRAAIEKDRLLILSPFVNSPKRITRESALLRNKFVAALCDEAFIGYAGKGSHTETVVRRLNSRCPLTYLEVWLRSMHDPSTTYIGSFIIHYVEKIVYIELSQGLIFVSTVILCVLNLWIYMRKR